MRRFLTIRARERARASKASRANASNCDDSIEVNAEIAQSDARAAPGAAATHESGSAEASSAWTAARAAAAPRRGAFAVALATASAAACRGVQSPPMPMASPAASKSLTTTAPKLRMTQAITKRTVSTSPELHAARSSVAAPARVPSLGGAHQAIAAASCSPRSISK